MEQVGARLVREDCERVVSALGNRFEGLRESVFLISGGTGFMGCWLAELFCCLNDTRHTKIHVYLLSRDQEAFERRLPHFAGRADVQFIRCDVRNVVDLPREVTHVIHAAATPDSRHHASNPIETMTTVAEGTSAMLKAADRASNLRMFVNVSSSAVYGSASDVPQLVSEGYQGRGEIGAVKAAYGESKCYAETLCAAARSEARMPIVTIRPFTFIGPYQSIDAPWAINNFMADALAKRAIRILGDGMTIRGVMYGADMAAWIATIAQDARSGQVYNLGNDEGMSLSAIAKKIASEMHPSPDIILHASLTGAIPSSVLVPDTSAAQRDFGLRVITDIDTAIVRTMRWYQSLCEAEGGLKNGNCQGQ